MLDKYRITAGGDRPVQYVTEAQIKAAAKDGLELIYDHEIPCRLAANCRGYITAVTAKGNILQDWACYFTVA